MFGVNNANGLAAISDAVDNNFNVKTYTEQMLNAIANPTANLANTAAAYQYFTAMYNGTNYTSPTGQTINFGNVSPALAAQLHTDVIKVLSDYNTVNVPYDAKGDTTPLLDSTGKSVSLLDLIQNPTGTFHVDFKVDQRTVEGQPTFGTFFGGNLSVGGNSPSWAPTMDQNYVSSDQRWMFSHTNWGGTDNFGVGSTGLNASVSQGACTNNLSWDISGSAADWEKAGALNPVASNPTQTSGDCTALEGFLAAHF